MEFINLISKKAGILAILIVFSAACTKTFVDINTATSGEPASFVTVQQIAIDFFSYQMATGEYIPMNQFYYPVALQGAMYKSSSDYGNGGAGGPGNDWNNFYKQLGDYRLILSKIGGDSATTYYNNLVFMMKVLNSYQVLKVSNLYGDMPYSQAGYAIFGPSPETNYYPAFDSQKTIYETAIVDLQDAADSFNTDITSQFPMTGIDVVLLNNIPQWIKFANSLRLRAAVTMYAKDPGFAGPQIADVLSKPLLTDYAADNVGMYPANVPGASFSGRSGSFSSELYMRMGTTMWEQMSSTNDSLGTGIFDPRCNLFFEPNGLGHWVPMPQCPNPLIPDGGSPYSTARYTLPGWNSGKDGNNYANFNVFWGADVTIPDLFITAAQVHLLKAEAYLTGMGVTADMSLAQSEYIAGATGSINFWTTEIMNSPQWAVNKPTALPSQQVMNNFLNTPQVAFDMTDPTTALNQIYAQEWIDLFRQPWEAWTLQRRTGATPTETNPDYFSNYASLFGIYQRISYSTTNEATDNEANWLAATGGASGDLTTNKIWIAK